MITSDANKFVAEIKKLRDKKYRSEFGLYFIEGERLVCDAVRYGADVKHVILADGASDKYVGFLTDKQVVLSDKVFASLSETVNPQGIAAAVKLPSSALRRPCKDCIILDNVSDPGNVGTLLRSAAAFGYTDVYSVGGADVYSGKVIRSAMSAHFLLNLYRGTAEEIFETIKDDCEILLADANGSDAKAFQPRAKKIALVLGNEANGISSFFRQNCPTILSVPMENKFESLNVAVAGGILLYILNLKRRSLCPDTANGII